MSRAHHMKLWIVYTVILGTHNTYIPNELRLLNDIKMLKYQSIFTNSCELEILWVYLHREALVNKYK